MLSNLLAYADVRSLSGLTGQWLADAGPLLRAVLERASRQRTQAAPCLEYVAEIVVLGDIRLRSSIMAS